MLRLQLGYLKTQRGWQHDSLDEIEPKVNQVAAEISRKRRAEHAEVVSSASHLNPQAKRQALDSRGGASSFDVLQEDPHIPSRQPTYYDNALPSAPLPHHIHSPYAGMQPFSPHATASDSGFGAYINSYPQASPPRLRTKTPISATSEHFPGSPVSSAREESPFDTTGTRPSSSATHHPSNRRLGSMPSISTVHAQALQQHQQQQLQQRGPFSPRPNEVQRTNSSSSSGDTHVQPLSTSDPNFDGSAKEFVAAASTLTGMTRSQSEEAIEAVSSSTSSAPHHNLGRPSTPKSTSAPAFARPKSKDEDGEEDAELMLLFAGSPSPKTKKQNASLTRPGIEGTADLPGSSMKGRQLFADSESSDAASSGSGFYPDLLRQHSDEGSASMPNSAPASFNPFQAASTSQASAGTQKRATAQDQSYNYASSANQLDPAFNSSSSSSNSAPKSSASFGLSQPAPIQSSTSNFDVGSFFDHPQYRPSPAPPLEPTPSWA